MFDFSGKVAVVTGAAGNLGQVVGRSFLDCGARVALVDRREGRLRPLFDRSAGAERCHFTENVNSSTPEDMRAVVDGMVERFGQVDILVHTSADLNGHTCMKPRWRLLKA